ncbi:ATP-binding protein [Geothrix sp. 21YS21S-4]|uniref:ATP-binding protein n=1 Tax=Geothrix sp. 21YS21S-4 TaxID=3068889 RepID=UPI0027B91304|nr:ATP-binding protein [Geothrix sp. 21YS21S-4]
MLPIRRLLLRDLLVLMAGVSALLLGLAWWSQQQALEHQASARARTALEHLDTSLRRDLEASESIGGVIRDWWVEGILDLARPDQTARIVMPVLSAQHSITSLNLARTDGASLLFLRIGGAWSYRELQDAGPRARVRWHRLDPTGRILSSGPWTPMDYDPRTRPWYQTGALAATPVWTDPYVFYTTQDPGVTFTLPIRDGAGLQGVAALDFLLDDLTEAVWAAQPSPRSRCLVTDLEGRALILPRDAAFETVGSRRRAFLKPLPREILGGWTGPRGSAKDAQHITLGTAPAFGLALPFEGLAGLHWRLLLVVPEEDLLGPAHFRVGSMLGLAVLALGLAAWRIRRIARYVAEPIAELSALAEALGQGEPPPATTSEIQEIRSLDHALRKAGETLADRARLQRQLEHSQRMETVGTLAGGIAHDVNNQLAAILGQLHLSRELLPEGHPVLNRILRAEEATRRCAQTTKALLSFSHQSRPELKRLDLNLLVGETATILDRLLGGRIRLVLDLDPALPRVRGDAVQLEQVLMNLAVNARDAMPNGGTLELRTAAAPPGLASVEVLDSGQGIAPAALSHIFEPFYTTKELGKGTGLGLAMAFGIVKAHQGTIQASNRPEGGARFRITFPAADGEDDPQPHPKEPLRAETRLAGVKILVVEDEALLRDMLADALTLARAQVAAAPDGAVAWQAWQAASFDLVLSDHRMPDCTGLELLERIRAAGSDTPFILISGQGLEGMEATLAQDPRVRLLPKPFEMPRLLALMDELLAGHALE